MLSHEQRRGNRAFGYEMCAAVAEITVQNLEALAKHPKFPLDLDTKETSGVCALEFDLHLIYTNS